MELSEGFKIMPTTKLLSGPLSIRCDRLGAAGQPASSTSTTSFQTVMTGEPTPAQERQQLQGNLPQALLETLAKATMRGESIDDLETFDCFVARTLAQHGGLVPMDAVRSRRKI
eukprot:3963278-Pyramimonas_sp.AAC.1